MKPPLNIYRYSLDGELCTAEFYSYADVCEYVNNQNHEGHIEVIRYLQVNHEIYAPVKKEESE